MSNDRSFGQDARARHELRKACLTSLTFPEMQNHRKDIARVSGTSCTWLLAHGLYQRWLGQESGALWIKGKPGAGKSTLLNFAFQKAQPNKHVQHATEGSEIVASFFFHNRGVRLQREPLGLFRCLLHQILLQSDSLLDEFARFYKNRCDSGEEDWNWHVTDLQDFLREYIIGASDRKPLRIYIDALDECEEHSVKTLMRYFEEVASDSPQSRLSLCFSCREDFFPGADQGQLIHVDKCNHDDIAMYVSEEFRLARCSQPDIEQKIVDRASGVFQWAVLVTREIVEMLQGGDPLKLVRERVEKIPDELNGLYSRILGKIDVKVRESALLLLQWVCFAATPLSLEELRLAMAVSDYGTSQGYDSSDSSDDCYQHGSLEHLCDSSEYVDTDQQMRKRSVRLSKGLVEVIDSRVQFIHQTVKDYLLQGGLESLYTQPPSSIPGDAHFKISRSCIKYIFMEEVVDKFDDDRQGSNEKKGNLAIDMLHPKELDPDEKSRDIRFRFKVNRFLLSSSHGALRAEFSHKFPLLQYAASNLASHLKSVELACIPQDDLLSLFHWRLPRLTQCLLWLERIYKCHFLSEEDWTLLHFSCARGLLSVVRSFFSQWPNADTDQKTSSGQSLLHCATSEGHADVVKFLLRRQDVDINSTCKVGQTPLLLAALRTDTTVLKLLLAERGVEVNRTGRGGTTPLAVAACGGNAKAVEYMLNLDIEYVELGSVSKLMVGNC